MLKYKIVQVQGHEPHTHGIRIEEGVYEGLVFVFGKIEFIGQDTLGRGRWLYDYDILVSPDNVKKEDLELEIGEILNQLLEDSAGISEIEEREQEIKTELSRVEKLPQETVVRQPDGTTVELEELVNDQV